MNETNEAQGEGVEPVAETAPHQAEQQPEGKKKPKKKRGFQPRPGHAVQAFTFALDPGSETEQRLRSHCGGARTDFNWARNHVLATWDQRAAEASYGVAESERTPWRSWSLPSLRRAFNAAKRQDPRFASWWADNSKEAYNTGLAGAAAGFDAYAAAKRGDRKGPKVGVPRPKSKHRAPSLEAVGQGRPGPQQGAPPGGECAHRRAAPPDHCVGRGVRHSGGGGSERGRDGQEPASGPPHP
ncbi:hypothetical protein GCM10027590_49820 [Nocardiopsis nanhaiensis]